MTALRTSAVSFVLAVSLCHGQSSVGPDSSGNGFLKGNYYVRQLTIANFDQNANVSEVAVISGNLAFDGKGAYTLTGQKVDNTIAGGQAQTIKIQATYGIGANGVGSLDNPLAATDAASRVYGSVGQGGVFVGSSTEGVYDDVFIAIPAGASGPANSSFNGTYWLGLLDFAGANESALKNALFKVAPNGTGALGPLSISGQASNQTASSLTQSVTGATYSFGSDGIATLNIPLPSSVPAANALFAGTKTMYLSADGNFILGGTAGGYDIFFGIRALAGNASNATYQGLYFLGGLEDAVSGSGVDSFYGSANSNGAGTQILHERVTAPYLPSAIDYGTDDEERLNADGTTQDVFGYRYAFGVEGSAFVAIGSSGFYSLQAGVHSQSFSGTGTFLSPIGITHAASYSPITASLAPGELIDLFGSGLAPVTLTTQGGQPFQTTLGGVQVSINGVLAPIYFVSPGQISVIVPYPLDLSNGVYFARVQVNNNGTKSNAVTLYVNSNAPGIFTQSQNGIGTAAALRQDGSLLTSANPAKRGEYVSLFLTGLGAVSPAVQDGAVGPTTPLSQASVFIAGNLQVYFNDYDNNVIGAQGTVTYAGLAPGLAGLYQVNVQVPTTVGPGNVYIEIVTEAADINQVYIPVSK